MGNWCRFWMDDLEGDDAMTISWHRDLAMSALLVFRERRPRYYTPAQPSLFATIPVSNPQNQNPVVEDTSWAPDIDSPLPESFPILSACPYSAMSLLWRCQ